jgi:hypothetical protein
VSVDLVVWEGPAPASDADAVATLEHLSERFLGTRRTPPNEAITDYVVTLLRRYPDLADEDHEPNVDVPWGSGPLLNNASGPIVYIDMKLNNAFHEGWRYCVELASARGLVAFDPQTGGVADPDPTATREPSGPDGSGRGTGIGARLYRWSALRSYRWPILTPVASLLRRYR